MIHCRLKCFVAFVFNDFVRLSVLFFFQINVPMSVEFEELAKFRENPSEETQGLYASWIFIFCTLMIKFVFIDLPTLMPVNFLVSHVVIVQFFDE